MKILNVIRYVRHLNALACNAIIVFFQGLSGIRKIKIIKNSSNPLNIPQYGAEGVVHPDILHFTNGLDGFKFWLYYTPYPPESLENPCLVRSNNGVDFTDSGVSNPLIKKGAKGEWDDGHLADVAVLRVNRTWYLYYVGSDESKSYQKIGLATSTDGKTFTKNPKNPVMWADTSLCFEEGDFLVSPTVTHIGDKYFMWYFSQGNDSKWRMCFAESSDGERWTKQENNPVLGPTSKPYWWDKERIWHGDVVHYSDEYWLLYSGYDGHVFRLGFARSKDGVNWEKYDGNPIMNTIQGTWEGAFIYSASPAVIDDKLWIYYSAFRQYYHNPRIGLAWIGLNYLMNNG
jgi:predicted GH43/DUF377 family glycosyl hydrolase